MLKTFKFIVRKFEKKTGGTFTKAEVKGKFINLATTEDEVYYTVKFVSKSVELPNEEGIYEVSYTDGDLWVDQRPEYAEKHILRVKPFKCVFSKPLPRLEKDVRLVK